MLPSKDTELYLLPLNSKPSSFASTSADSPFKSAGTASSDTSTAVVPNIFCPNKRPRLKRPLCNEQEYDVLPFAAGFELPESTTLPISVFMSAFASKAVSKPESFLPSLNSSNSFAELSRRSNAMSKTVLSTSGKPFTLPFKAIWVFPVFIFKKLQTASQTFPSILVCTSKLMSNPCSEGTQ